MWNVLGVLVGEVLTAITWSLVVSTRPVLHVEALAVTVGGDDAFGLSIEIRFETSTALTSVENSFLISLTETGRHALDLTWSKRRQALCSLASTVEFRSQSVVFQVRCQSPSSDHEQVSINNTQ